MYRRIIAVLPFAAAISLAGLVLPAIANDAVAGGYHGDRHDRHWDWDRRGHGHKYKHKWDRYRHSWHRGPVHRAPVYYVRHVRPPRNSINIYIGSYFGTVLDGVDWYNVQYALETVPTGNAVVWSNASTGYRYSVTPVRTWQAPDSTYCREYTTVGTVGGRQQQLYGTACRQPDGSWETQ